MARYIAFILRAFRSEAGAVTVDWAVLLASVVLLSLSIIGEIDAGVALLTETISTTIDRL